MTALSSLRFITMIPIDCKIINFSLYLLTFFSYNYYIGDFTSAVSKERVTTNIIYAIATPID